VGFDRGVTTNRVVERLHVPGDVPSAANRNVVGVQDVLSVSVVDDCVVVRQRQQDTRCTRMTAAERRRELRVGLGLSLRSAEAKN
jgi:hypothetical protein